MPSIIITTHYIRHSLFCGLRNDKLKKNIADFKMLGVRVFVFVELNGFNVTILFS